MNIRGAAGIKVVKSGDSIRITREDDFLPRIEVSSFPPPPKLDVSTLDFYSYADGTYVTIMPGTIVSPELAYAGVIKIPSPHSVTPGVSVSGYIYLEIPMFQPPIGGGSAASGVSGSFTVLGNGYVGQIGSQTDVSGVDGSWSVASPGYAFYSSLQANDPDFYKKVIATVTTDADGIPIVAPVHLGVITLPQGTTFYFGMEIGEP